MADISYKQTMVCLSSQNRSDLNDIVVQVQEAGCMENLRTRTVDLVHRAFESTSTIFWMINEENTLIDPVMKGIQNQFLLPYKSHFFRQNPFDPINVSELKRPSVAMEQLISLGDFQKTEYYNDFLRPQNINRQMAVYIRQGNRLKGVIGMHRSVKNRFGEKFLFMGDLISVQLTAAFENMRLIEELNRSRDILSIIQENPSTGFILLNDRLQLVFSNTKADLICSRLGRKFALVDLEGVTKCRIPDIILRDCRSDGCSILKLKERILSAGSGERYHVKCQSMSSEQFKESKGGFMITLADDHFMPDINPDLLKKRFGLTPREIEIISYIFKGFTNLEIADTLFISEGTVKNHLKHIFAKTGAANRTNLIHKAVYSDVRHF